MDQLIEKKRDGQALAEREIRFFINGYTAGEIPDYQMAALLMAIYFQGMNRAETVNLTMAMAQSGDMLDLSDICDYAVDKHSSGGVGDKTSLVVLPLVASFGVPIAKMSGRGLGATGGTVDKLESISGFKVDLSDAEFRRIARETGLVIGGQSKSLAPADGLIYALRDVTATVASRSLIASSIMSKKLAAGARGIVLDVKLGRGAFMKSLQDARALATAMVRIGLDAGRDMVALLSDVNQPLGVAVGNALEVAEAVKTLRGEGPAEFRSAWKLWALPGDTLWAGDYRPWRYNVFTREGEWVRAVQMSPIYGNPSRRGGVLDNGVSINTVEKRPVPRDFRTPDTVVVEAHGPDGERLAVLGRILHTTYGPDGMYQLFTASAVVEAGGSTIALGRTTEPELRLLDEEMQLRRILRWPDTDRDVGGADVRAWRDNYIRSRGGRDSPNWHPSDEDVVSDDVPAAEEFPAFSSARIGRDGRVWVLPYRGPRGERVRWMGFEPDGEFLCHLENSHSGLTLYEFGADYWLGVQADELGVETVVVFGLTVP